MKRNGAAVAVETIPATGETETHGKEYALAHKDEILVDLKAIGWKATQKKHRINAGLCCLVRGTWKKGRPLKKDKPTGKRKYTRRQKPASTGNPETSTPKSETSTGLQPPPAGLKPYQRQAWNKEHQAELVELVKTVSHRDLVGVWGLASSTIANLRRLAGMPAKQKPGPLKTTGTSVWANLSELPVWNDSWGDAVKVAWLQAYVAMRGQK